MTGQTLALSPLQTTDAQFRAWGSAISAALATQGLVQTADTGQINWSTVTRPTVGGASQGYEVWRFNDALQASAPVFIKLEYGSASQAAIPQMWITVGVGSDSAGNLTGTNVAGVYGAITTRRAVGPNTNGNPPTGTGNVYVNGDSGCMAVLAWPAQTVNWGGFVILVERWRNWDGTNSADGVTVFSAQSDGTTPGNASQALCFVPNLAANPGTSAAVSTNMHVPSSGLSLLSAAISTTLYPLPVLTGPGPRAGAPSQFVLACGFGDYPTLGSFTMSHYGTSRTWLSAGIGSGTAWGSWGAGNIKSFIFRTS